jgi:hypothetical protein
MLGMHKRQGDQSYPDKAISIEVMMALMARFDAAWEVAKGQEKEEGADLFPASSIATASASFRSPSPRHQLPFVLSSSSTFRSLFFVYLWSSITIIIAHRNDV